MLSSYLHCLIDLVDLSKKLFKMIHDFLLQETRYIFLYVNTCHNLILIRNLHHDAIKLQTKKPSNSDFSSVEGNHIIFGFLYAFVSIGYACEPEFS